MKKYTNKILIIVISAFLLAFTIRFIIIANKIIKEINQSETKELTIK
jgi:YbbR domain-containing protein